MKTRRILATVLTIAMLVTLLPATTLSVSAETAPVVFTKELLPIADGQPRKIKLEAYTTGSTSSTSATVPADICLQMQAREYIRLQLQILLQSKQITSMIMLL